VKKKISKKRLRKVVKAFKPNLKRMKNGDSLTFNYSKRFSIEISKGEKGYFILPIGFSDGLLISSLSGVETALSLLIQCYAEGIQSVKPVKTNPAEIQEDIRKRTIYIA